MHPSAQPVSTNPETYWIQLIVSIAFYLKYSSELLSLLAEGWPPLIVKCFSEYEKQIVDVILYAFILTNQY